MNPPDATAICDELDRAYAQCKTRADFLVIVIDALDQAGAPHGVQADVADALNRWDRDALDDATQAWIDGGSDR